VEDLKDLAADLKDVAKYLGLPFHQSGHIAHLITPKLNKAAASWAIVQQKHAQLSEVSLISIPFLPLLFTMVALFGACIVPQILLPTIFANSYNRNISYT